MCVFHINASVRIVRIFVYFCCSSHTYKVHNKTFCIWYRSQFLNENTFSWCPVVFQKWKRISVSGTASTSGLCIEWPTEKGLDLASHVVGNLTNKGWQLACCSVLKDTSFSTPRIYHFCELYVSFCVGNESVFISVLKCRLNSWQRVDAMLRVPLSVKWRFPLDSQLVEYLC